MTIALSGYLVKSRRFSVSKSIFVNWKFLILSNKVDEIISIPVSGFFSLIKLEVYFAYVTLDSYVLEKEKPA